MENLQLEELRKELEYWLQHEPVNNMGKLAQQTKIDSLKEQIQKLEESKKIDNPTTNNK